MPRAPLYKQIQERHVADAPIDFMLEVPCRIAMKTTPRGFSPIPPGQNMFVETAREK